MTGQKNHIKTVCNLLNKVAAEIKVKNIFYYFLSFKYITLRW